MMFTATFISRKVVGENVHMTVLIGSMGYDRIIHCS